MNYNSKAIAVLFIFNFSFLITQAQVAINTDNSDPDASAMLDISSTDKGLLIPRMDSTARNNIIMPAEGLMVFDSTTNSFWYYTDTWQEIGGAFVSINGLTSSSSNEDDFVFGADSLDRVAFSERKFFFDKGLGAFRAGSVSGNNWDASNRGEHSVAFGQNTRASGISSTAFGTGNIASGIYSTAFGQNTVASGTSTTAFGSNTSVDGVNTTAFGNGTTADGSASLAFGFNTVADGNGATAFGNAATASNTSATAFGNSTVANGVASTAFGGLTAAQGDFSMALGIYDTAYSYAEVVLGSYSSIYTANSTNTFDSADRLFVIGNGTALDARSDALRIYKNGNAELNGALTIDSAYTFPVVDGDSLQVLTTDGNGTLSWTEGTGADNLGNHTATQNIQLDDFWLSNDGDNEGINIDSSGNVGVGLLPTAQLSVSLGKIGTDGVEVAGPSNLNDEASYEPENNTTWQSYTASTNGILTRVTLRFKNNVFARTFGSSFEDEFTMNIYEGEGIAGMLLGTTTITVSVAGNNPFTRDFNLSSDFIEQQNGSIYTISIQTATRYDVFYSTGDTYSGGALEGDLGFDLYFATYTEGFARFDVGENGVSVNDYTLPTSDGASGQLLATDGTGTLYWENDSSIDDQMVDKFELSGTTLQLSLENDGKDDYTADLSSLQDNLGNHTATQNIQLDNNWISNDGSDKGISVTDNGYVGIGINPATKALLEVSGEGPTVTTTGDLAFYSFDGWNADVTSLSQPYSIYASGRIAGLVFHAISDERVKDIQGISDSKADLKTLQKIQITDYQFKDQLQNSDGSQKKVIAQQVAKVYPQAVQSNTTEVVPDIYKKAIVKDGWIELAIDLKVGEKVKIITDTNNEIHEVIAVEDGRFKVSNLELHASQLFIYGRQVNDFHTVDYEAISMLNVSATQELAKENEELKKRIEILEDQVAKINQLEVMLEQLQAQMNPTRKANSSRK